MLHQTLVIPVPCTHSAGLQYWLLWRHSCFIGGKTSERFQNSLRWISNLHPFQLVQKSLSLVSSKFTVIIYQSFTFRLWKSWGWGSLHMRLQRLITSARAHWAVTSNACCCFFSNEKSDFQQLQIFRTLQISPWYLREFDLWDAYENTKPQFIN